MFNNKAKTKAKKANLKRLIKKRQKAKKKTQIARAPSSMINQIKEKNRNAAD